MAKPKDPVITVSAVFAGKQSDRQAFIDLILQKQEIVKSQYIIDNSKSMEYTKDTPKRGIHSGMEDINEP